MEDGRDAVAQARADPERIAGVDRLPWAIRGWDFAPGRSALHHRQHPLQLLPQIAAGTSPMRSGWSQQRRDLLPLPRARLSGTWHDENGNRSRHRGTRLCRWWTPCSPRAMAATSDRLVLASPGRPAQPVVARGALGLGQHQEPPPHLRDRQGDRIRSARSVADPPRWPRGPAWQRPGPGCPGPPVRSGGCLPSRRGRGAPA